MKKFVLGLTLLAAVGSANASGTKTTAPSNGTPKVTLTKDNMLLLSTYIDEQSVAKTVKIAKEMDARLKSNEPMYFVLNSGGGSIDSGLEMIENLQSLNRPVHTITIFSASMAFHTVQGLGNRYILANGTLMTHKAKGGFEGEFPGQLDSRYGYYLKRIFRMDEQVVARTKGKHNKKSYADLYENEYWCDGQECIKQGFSDLVIKAQCDKSLDGTRDEVEKLIFMGMPVEITLVFDKCPLNTGLLDVKVAINGEQLFSVDKEKPVQKTKVEDRSYYYSSRDHDWDKEDLVKLNEAIQAKIKKITNREVIKGY